MNSSQRQSSEAAFATKAEAAAYLNVLRQLFFQKLADRGDVPAWHCGRSIRIPWSFLRAKAEVPAL